MDTATLADATASTEGQPAPAGRSELAPASPEDFTVGGWLVQPTLGRVSRGHTVLRLRPQLIDVLVCLASGNGRTVGRQELVDRVWHGRFSTGSAIARSLAELRQVMGDDARQPRIIETIPKRGYRIIAPISRDARMPNVEGLHPVGVLPTAGTRLTSGRWRLVVLLAVVITIVVILLAR